MNTLMARGHTVSNTEERMRIYNQYRQAFGDLAEAGKFKVGERVIFDNGAGWGKVIWKYINRQGTLTYVVDSNSGFPVEVDAQEVREL